MGRKPHQQKRGLRVRRAARGAGLGLFTEAPIRRGTFIIEYTGELVSDTEADRRGGKYLFDLNSRWTIDGSARLNLARYINHACRPNSEAKVVGKRVKIYATKNISAGEEITYDYGKEYFDEYIAPKGCHCRTCAKKTA